MENRAKLLPGFYWASAGGNPLEICEVKQESGTWVARTIGCPDPFFLSPEGRGDGIVLYTAHPQDREKCNVGFSGYFPSPLTIPELPEHMGGRKPRPSHSHSWRGPRDY